MSRRLAVLIMAASIGGGGWAYAQDTNPGSGTFVVTVIPGGTMFFTDHNGRPGFTNYDLGGSGTYNINRFIGVEGEVGGSLGISQDLRFTAVTSSQKTPNMLTYSGNVVISYPVRRSFSPYATGGVGGLSLFERAELGVNSSETFFTGNVGGGAKWFAPNGRWGLRGDYRFFALESKENAPDFVGPDSRYAHRIYGAVVINAVR
jgi:Outer membrane protein beta-barrel domain